MQQKNIFPMIAISAAFFCGLAAAAEPTPAEKAAALESALDELTSCECIETPLSTICQYLEEVHQLQPIQIDKAALKELSLNDPPVTVQFKDPVRLYAGLRLTLGEVSPDLAVLPKDDHLIITSAKKSWCTLRYDVSDLVAAAEKGRVAGSKPEAEAIRNLIANSVSSGSWKEGGGTGTITVEKNVLVVQNFAREQWEVRDLLTDLRKDLITQPERDLKTVGDKVRHMAQRIFKGVDGNGDGMGSGAELEGHEYLDRNKDKQVTFDECVAYVREVRIVRDRRK